MDWARVWTGRNWERLLVGNLFTNGEVGGLLLTMEIGLLAIILSTVLGALLGILRHSRRRLLWVPAAAYIETLRNIPLLILVFWAYFVPPYFGVQTSKFGSVLGALTLFTAAYIAEVVRGGLLAVPPGVVDAGRALGLSRSQNQLRVVLPIAFFNMIPALSGRYVVAIKNTSLAFLIGLSDLTEVGKEISNVLMTSPVEVYVTLMLIYFSVNTLISHAMRLIETRRRFGRIFVRL
ncbi:MAG TPA: amino acid ABC transporter permease [Burkholderiales bacterium]|nr:amino acid ABC transporter permease [Burkholderiales bacterium]